MFVADTRTFAGISVIVSSRPAAFEIPNHFQLSSFAEIVPPQQTGRKTRRQNKRKQQAVTMYFRVEEGHF
jgi:hypothetical protein